MGAVLDKIPGGPHEIVMVDDGSSDGTAQLLEEAAERDPRIVGVLLSRNFGHQVAITAAMDQVSGDVIVIMDGDLQDPPEVIPQLLAKYDEGYDVVFAQRGQRQEGWYLRICYWLFYRLVTMLSNVPLPLDSGDFALLSRRVVDAMRVVPERQRYLRGLRAGSVSSRPAWWLIAPGVTPVLEIHAAQAVEAGFGRYFRLFHRPLVRGARAGPGSDRGLDRLRHLRHPVRLVFESNTPPGFASLIVVIVFLAGMQLMILGVVGEYVGRIYEEVKGRPHYILRKVVRGK